MTIHKQLKSMTTRADQGCWPGILCTVYFPVMTYIYREFYIMIISWDLKSHWCEWQWWDFVSMDKGIIPGYWCKILQTSNRLQNFSERTYLTRHLLWTYDKEVIFRFIGVTIPEELQWLRHQRVLWITFNLSWLKVMLVTFWSQYHVHCTIVHPPNVTIDRHICWSCMNWFCP